MQHIASFKLTSSISSSTPTPCAIDTDVTILIGDLNDDDGGGGCAAYDSVV